MLNKKFIIAAKAELSKRKFYRFFLEFWDEVSKEELVENWHIEYLCEEMQVLGEAIIKRQVKPYDLCINIPPGESKSSICSVLFPVWLWVNDDSLKIISASYEAGLANALNVKSSDLIKSDKFRLLYPNVKIRHDMDSKSHTGLVGGGERFAVGSRGNMIGKHANVILIDDPMNPKSAHSELERTSVNGWLSGTVPTRMVNKENTPIALIMQRLHDEDSTNEFLTKFKNVKHICLPATESPLISPPELKSKYVNGLMNPLRLSYEVLASYRKLDNYEGQFDQSPVKEGGNIIKKQWFGTYNLGALLNAAKANKTNLVWNFCVDGAYTSNTKNAATVCIAWTYFQNRIYIRGIYRNWVSITEFLADVPTFLLENGYSRMSRVWVEPKASGLDLIDTLVTFKGINALKGEPPTTDKISAAHGITPTLAAGRVLLLEGCEENEEFLRECEVFPKGKWKDQVDTLVMVVNKATSTAFVSANN